MGPDVPAAIHILEAYLSFPPQASSAKVTSKSLIALAEALNGVKEGTSGDRGAYQYLAMSRRSSPCGL
jgi:hypothetical protein